MNTKLKRRYGIVDEAGGDPERALLLVLDLIWSGQLVASPIGLQRAEQRAAA